MVDRRTLEEQQLRINQLEQEVATLKDRSGTVKKDARRSRRILESTGAGYFFISKDGILKDVNKSWLLMYGYSSPEEVVGRHFTMIQQGKDIELAKERFAGILRGDERYMQGELKRICKDGSIGYHVYSSGPVSSPAGGVVGIEGFVFDLTQRKVTENKMRLHSEIMANMVEGVFLVRLDGGNIVFANPKFEEMFGYGPGEMIGKHVSIVNAQTHKSPRKLAEEIIRTLREIGEWHGEVNNIKKDGTSFWTYANVSMFDHSEYGEVLVSVHSDITEKKRNEQERQRLEEQRKTIEQNLLKKEILLEKRNTQLTNSNAALQALLDQREKDRIHFEEQILFQHKNLVSPIIKKLRKANSAEVKNNLLEIVEFNLKEITSPFLKKFSALRLILTPQEIQIANMVQQGMSSKEIAEILNLSPGTISNHRKSIRKKLGFNQKKANLRTYLLSSQ